MAISAEQPEKINDRNQLWSSAPPPFPIARRHA